MNNPGQYKEYYIIVGKSFSSDIGLNILPEIRIMYTSDTDKWLRYHYDRNIPKNCTLYLCKIETEYNKPSLFKSILEYILPTNFNISYSKYDGDVYVGSFKSHEDAARYMVQHLKIEYLYNNTE